ncbi:LysE family translocator [Vibrio metschnikovii]|uniref:LysE family translocator n=1 Tax=bacterium 19PA01SH03 TaxID=2920705 RepID=A0AAU6SPQ3_UNCXX|nr:LysE family translocator [Vibrio metschnikovii]EKO3569656.1 LysE family translocator [Vibrio metschnikovii]EKO3584487.1 LysE family translocator [Vibrio metschnikovii]EKO3595846.1 LysE family translocator [Vibrio metschnikovii]EKO3603147.1 LysE family translocator [Vibrio metschnikovii]
MTSALLLAFVPTFFFVSITPGMCMTLALSLGMSIGYRRTLWMMFGELIGVAVVAMAAVLGMASVMLNYPWLFAVFKTLGAAYLGYIGVQMWRSKGKLALNQNVETPIVRKDWDLIVQGFVTAIANPKGWAFMIALLPPFINSQAPIAPQLFWLISIIMISEFVCMTIYATGGKGLKRALGHTNNVRLINRISATLMLAVAVWLLLG